MGATKKDADMDNGEGTKKHIEEEKAVAELSSVPIVSTTPPATMESLKVREPIPADQQLELFKWILEEKRKVKPKDLEEKKRIDEEKAVLKHFIKTKSVPNLKF